MSPDAITAWAQLAGTIGGNTMLVLAIVGILKGWVVTAQHLRDVRELLEAQLARKNATISELRNGRSTPPT